MAEEGSAEDLSALPETVRVGTNARERFGRALRALTAVTGLRRDRRRGADADDHARQSEHLATALCNMTNGLVIIGSDGLITLFSDRVREVFPILPDDIAVGMPWQDYIRNVGKRVGWDEARIGRVIANHVQWMGLTTVTNIEHNYDDGSILSIHCRPLPDGGTVLTYDDVTEERIAQRQMAHMAFHDALTGLPNRRSFRAELDEALRTSMPAALLMIDLDGFKAVNDALGHATGDELLIEVAERLREVCTHSEFIARLGGDEIAILHAPGTIEAAGALAERIRTALAEPFLIAQQSVSIGCSIGLTLTDGSSTTGDLLQQADLALYRAKRCGRNQVQRFEPGMLADAHARRQLKLDLARALRNNEFRLCYQPLHDLKGGGIFGFEALIRWMHPERGMVSPAEFIPFAEETGAILAIGEWVLKEACRQAASWPQHVNIAVNISSVQLRANNLAAQLACVLAETGLSAHRLELELTETAMVENAAEIAATLSALRKLGVRIAMDDFGTGFSSLAHLCNLELDRIKIDRSFVATARESAASHAILRAVAQIGRDLGIPTIGEGVEKDDHLLVLKSLGCMGAQGYMLGAPMSADAATSFAFPIASGS